MFGYTGGVAIAPQDETSCSKLDSLHAVNIHLCEGVPYCRSIFHDGSHKGLVCRFFHSPGADLQVSS